MKDLLHRIESAITIKRAPPGTHDKGKPFYAQVDGQNVGSVGEFFCRTKHEARALARRYIIAKSAFDERGQG